MSVSYGKDCVPQDKAAAAKEAEKVSGEQLDWLAHTLGQCAAASEKAWVMFHEPIGLNIYPTLQKGDLTNPADIEMFMEQDQYSSLLRKLDQGSDSIEVIFSGHTHMDDFRILRSAEGVPLVINHITPAVSPIFRNNPAYQVFTYDTATASLDNYVTRYLDVSVQSPCWKKEYDFQETYGMAPADAQAMMAVRQELGMPGTMQDNFMRFYDVSNTAASYGDSANWPAYFDSMDNVTRETFVKNYKPART